MRKASDILLIIGFVLGVLGVIVGIVLTITLFVAAGNRDAIIEGLKNGTIHTNFVGSVEQQADAIIRLIRGVAIGGVVGVILSIIFCVVSLLAERKGTVGLYIAALIFSVLATNIVSIVGAILGLVSGGQDDSEPQVE